MASALRHGLKSCRLAILKCQSIGSMLSIAQREPGEESLRASHAAMGKESEILAYLTAQSLGTRQLSRPLTVQQGPHPVGLND